MTAQFEHQNEHEKFMVGIINAVGISLCFFWIPLFVLVLK